MMTRWPPGTLLALGTLLKDVRGAGCTESLTRAETISPKIHRFASLESHHAASAGSLALRPHRYGALVRSVTRLRLAMCEGLVHWTDKGCFVIRKGSDRRRTFVSPCTGRPRAHLCAQAT
jgi:hypothetical protein